MLIDFAARRRRRGVATAEDIDTAMRLGVNYPLRPRASGPSGSAAAGCADLLRRTCTSATPADATRPSLALLRRRADASTGGGALIMTIAKRDTYTPETAARGRRRGVQRARLRRHLHGAPLQGGAASPSRRSTTMCAGKEELLRRAVSRALDGLFGVLEEPGARARPGDRAAGVRHPAHGRGADGRAPVRDAAAAGARQHRHRAVGHGAPPGVRPPGRRAAQGRPPPTATCGRTWTSGWPPGCSSA